jgi:hypothetical protein
MPRHLRSRLPNERQTLARDQAVDQAGQFRRTFGVVCDLGSLESGRLRGKPHSHILEVSVSQVQVVRDWPGPAGIEVC